METKQPIRKTLKAMSLQEVVEFDISRYESVVSAVSRLNVTIPDKRWSTFIVRNNPDESIPVKVRVTRIA